MKVKMSLTALAVLALIAVVPICAVADSIDSPPPPTGVFEVEYETVAYCVSTNGSYCANFALWGGTAAGYIEFKDPNGTIDAYLWVDGTGELSFASGIALKTPPAGIPLLATITENGSLQQVNQYFPGGMGTFTRDSLYVESPVGGTTPEPSTILLVGSAAAFLVKRARRLSAARTATAGR